MTDERTDQSDAAEAFGAGRQLPPSLVPQPLEVPRAYEPAGASRKRRSRLRGIIDASLERIGERREDATVFLDSLPEDVPLGDDVQEPSERAPEDPSAERDFVTRLFEPRVADRLGAWAKSPNRGFYEIAYAWRKGDHTKRGTFSPDLFIRLADSRDVLVVVLTDDSDASDENKAMYREAAAHFAAINDQEGNVRYHVKFISPESHDRFFQSVLDGAAVEFMSALQVLLTT